MKWTFAKNAGNMGGMADPRLFSLDYFPVVILLYLKFSISEAPDTPFSS